VNLEKKMNKIRSSGVKLRRIEGKMGLSEKNRCGI